MDSAVCGEYSKGGMAVQADRVLSDKKENGRAFPWREKRKGALQLRDALIRLGDGYGEAAARTAQCGEYLDFRLYETGEKRLNMANFCEDRLCPLCNARRALRQYSNLMAITDYMDAHKDYKDVRFVFLTLTVRNEGAETLNNLIDRMFAGFHSLMRQAAVKRMSVGWFRALEITHNWDTDTYHPHFHVLIAVKKGYIESKENYLTHDEWVSAWRAAMRLDYDPSVNIKAVHKAAGRGNGNGIITYGAAASECAKYAAKPSDYLTVTTKGKDGKQHKIKTETPAEKEAYADRVAEAVRVYKMALYRRRLVAYGGALKEIHKLLQLTDPEEGGLEIVGNEENTPEVNAKFVIARYRWDAREGEYILSKVYEPGTEEFEYLLLPLHRRKRDAKARGDTSGSGVIPAA